MTLSRRQFFRRFWNIDEKTPQQRLARYEVLERDVRTYHLPYDFSISAEQEAEIFAAIRAALEITPDADLFSVSIIAELGKIVELKVQPWREAAWHQDLAGRAREIRQSAPDYVNTYLTLQATPQAVDQLKLRFEIEDSEALQTELRHKIEAWIADVPDDDLLQYDVFTVKDLVFDQLRSWC